MKDNFTFISDEVSQNLPTLIEFCKRNELGSIELRTIEGSRLTEKSFSELKRIRDVLISHDISTRCLASHVFKCDLGDEEVVRSHVSDFIVFLEICDIFECDLIRVFTFWESTRSDAKELIIARIRELVGLTLSSSSGVRIGIENGKSTNHRTADTVISLLEGIGSDCVGLIWDPANSIFGGAEVEPLKVDYERIIKMIFHVHLKFPHKTSDGGLVYGNMNSSLLNFKELYDNLQAFGYRNLFSLETHWREGKVFKQYELDMPGGSEFSEGGLSATQNLYNEITSRLSLEE